MSYCNCLYFCMYSVPRTHISAVMLHHYKEATVVPNPESRKEGRGIRDHGPFRSPARLVWAQRKTREAKDRRLGKKGAAFPPWLTDTITVVFLVLLVLLVASTTLRSVQHKPKLSTQHTLTHHSSPNTKNKKPLENHPRPTLVHSPTRAVAYLSHTEGAGDPFTGLQWKGCHQSQSTNSTLYLPRLKHQVEKDGHMDTVSSIMIYSELLRSFLYPLPTLNSAFITCSSSVSATTHYWGVGDDVTENLGSLRRTVGYKDWLATKIHQGWIRRQMLEKLPYNVRESSRLLQLEGREILQDNPGIQHRIY
jgi:hypothetical protein